MTKKRLLPLPVFNFDYLVKALGFTSVKISLTPDTLDCWSENRRNSITA